MRRFRLVMLVMLAALVVLPFAAVPANAQVAVGIGVGPAIGYPAYYGPPDCEWATTPITPTPALLTAFTGQIGSTAASSSAWGRGAAGAGGDELQLRAGWGGVGYSRELGAWAGWRAGG